MAAATRFLVKGRNKIVINVTGTWSVADEVDTILLDKSTLQGPEIDLREPAEIRIDEITWSIAPGFDSVLLEWDNSTDEVVDYFQGQGYMDYRPAGGKAPLGTGGTGDLILSTVGGAANDNYSLLIHCTLKGDA